jgi:hypothetical protein
MTENTNDMKGLIGTEDKPSDPIVSSAVNTSKIRFSFKSEKA